MPKVAAFEINGLELRFYSFDHNPPHFHVIKPGDWEIVVNILSTTEDTLDGRVRWSKRSGQPSAAVQRQIAQRVAGSRQQLLEEWESKVQVSEGGR